MAIDLVLGLGNPGAEYARTRHNVGFQVVEALLCRHGSHSWLKGKVQGNSGCAQPGCSNARVASNQRLGPLTG